MAVYTQALSLSTICNKRSPSWVTVGWGFNPGVRIPLNNCTLTPLHSRLSLAAGRSPGRRKETLSEEPNLKEAWPQGQFQINSILTSTAYLPANEVTVLFYRLKGLKRNRHLLHVDDPSLEDGCLLREWQKQTPFLSFLSFSPHQWWRCRMHPLD